MTVDDLIRELSELPPIDRTLQIEAPIEGVWAINTLYGRRVVTFHRPWGYRKP